MDADALMKALAAALPASPVPGVVAGYLFGSHRRGTAHRESDVDVGVLLDRSVHPTRGDRAAACTRLNAEVVHAQRSNDVDVVVLNDAPPELGRAIVTRGALVYSADPEAVHAFERDVQLRAADLAPFLRRTRRTKLESLGS